MRRSWLPSENTTLLILAVSLGLATGAGVWLFREGISFFQQTFRQGLLGGIAGVAGPWAVLGIIPALGLGGLIVGFLMDRFIGEERHHGVAGIMEATALAGGRLRYRRMPLKALLASFSLGAGASVGPEDPSVQIGANIGSLLGQRLRLSDERVKLLVAAGAAAGIAAAFRAPIAGVFFALEVILGDFSSSAFGVVVLSAVIASVVTQSIEAGAVVFKEAASPELGIAAYTLGGLQEIPFYVLLGILIAPVAALFIHMLYWQHDLWHHLKLPLPIKTAFAGALVGVIAVFLPQIMGTGQTTLNAMLNQNSLNFTLGLLLAMAVGKMVATTISLGGGFQGGMFAPSLFVGAALGRLFGQTLNGLFPGFLTTDPAAFAIAGMAAAMTGVIRAPITAVILLFELTDDYRLILPIMLTTVVCLIVVERLAPDGIYNLGLARQGIRLSRGRDIDLMQSLTVGEAMTPNPPTVLPSLPLTQLSKELEKVNNHAILVTTPDGALYGIVSLQDLARARDEGDLEGRTVADICTRDVLTIAPNVPVAQGLRLLGPRDLERLPVMDPNNPGKPIGILRRRDIVRAYEKAIVRKQDSNRPLEQASLETYSRAHIIELHVEPDSAAANHAIRDLHWPAGTVVATIRHGSQIIIPRGDTVLYVGDVLTLVMAQDQRSELVKILGKRAVSEAQTVVH